MDTPVEWLGAEVGLPVPNRYLDLLDVAKRAGQVDSTIAFPGLVNSHDHLEFNCYPPLGDNAPFPSALEWSEEVHGKHAVLVAQIERIPRWTRMRFGLLKNLLSGVTRIVHHGEFHEGAAGPIQILTGFDILHSPEFGDGGFAAGLKFWRARPVVAHLAEGTTEPTRRRALKFAKDVKRFRKLVAIHGICLRDSDFAELDALVWCPASNLFLFGATADVAAAKSATRIMFGTDATISAPGTLWDHLRLARKTQALSDAELFATVTAEPMRFWDRANAGRDFVLARRRHPDRWQAFYELNPADILVVVHDDEIVLADAALAQFLPRSKHPMHSFNVGSTTKNVAIDVNEIISEFALHAPALDVLPVVARLY